MSKGNVSSVAEELGNCKESLATWRKLHREGKLTKEKIPSKKSRLRKQLDIPSDVDLNKWVIEL